MGRTAKAKKVTPSLDSIKACFRNARENGDREEEAKWANQIGHAFKNRGEYVTALKWFRKDYEMSSKGSAGLDSAKLMPTCQSIGEVYLRLQNYDDALTWQHKHFQWAEQDDNLVEQQRASTQLGRTYVEMYEAQERLSALTDAKAYFEKSLDLARRLRTTPPAGEACASSFVVELVDAYNNLGLARSLAEDYKQAYKLYMTGLKLCNEEEVNENDAARSRIHHNLGRLYAELRNWEKAKEHTQIDIEICQNIPHPQGEAKGLMNLGDLSFKSRDYEQALQCYRRALQIAQTLEDEDNLCSQIKGNIEVVGQGKAKSKSFDEDMQKLSKIRRNVEAAKGTSTERNLIRQECKLLQELIARADELQAWDVHLGLAKRLKKLTRWLGDGERLGDALEIVASSYYNLRNFQKAIKWHSKSFLQCKKIGHLEGQIVAKINYGNALDASGKPEEALEAYEAALEAAKANNSPKMVGQQISALENIHYCYFIRLERLDDARDVDLQLKQLRHKRETPKVLDDDGDERCSETSSEGPIEDHAIADVFCYKPRENSHRGSSRGEKSWSMPSQRSRFIVSESEDDDADDYVPLATLRFPSRSSFPPRERSGNTKQRLNCGQRTQKTLGKIKPGSETQYQGRETHRGKGKSVSGSRNRKIIHIDHRKGVADNEMSEAWLDLSSHASKPSGEPVVVEDSDSDVSLRSMTVIGAKRTLRSAAHVADPVDLTSDEDMATFSRKKTKPSNLCARSSSSFCRLSSPLDDQEDQATCNSHLEDIPTFDDDVTCTSNIYLPVQTGNVPEHISAKFSEVPVPACPASAKVDFISATEVRLPMRTGNVPGHICTSCPEVPGATWSASVGVSPPPGQKTLSPRSNIQVPNSEGKHEPTIAVSPRPGQKPSGDTLSPRSNIQVANSEGKHEPTIADGGAGAFPEAKSNQLNNAVGTEKPSKTLQVMEDLYKEIGANSHKLGVKVGGVVNTPLLERYMIHCMAATVTPNPLLVEKLQSLKVSEEVVVAGCNIEDHDAQPLLTALGESDAFSLLDLSHNLLGNATVHAIQELIKSTDQTDLGLTLDLHCNKLGAGALLQICRCPVSLSRLEVLNLSGNRLTDAAARHFSKILKESQALAALNLESCGLTTRSLKQLTSALHPETSLTKLCIGNNNPIAGFAIQELLDKLSMLTSFSELDMKGLELDDAAVAGVGTLLQKSKSIAILNLKGTGIRNDGALVLSDALCKSSQRLAKLDLSSSGFNMEPAVKLCMQLMSIQSLSTLNLSGNNLDQKAAEVVAQGLAGTSCRLKVLDLSNCLLGSSSVLLIIQSLTEHASLQDLNLAGNIVDLNTAIPQPVDSAIVESRMQEVSEGQAESPSAIFPLAEYPEQSCQTVEAPTNGPTSASLPKQDTVTQTSLQPATSCSIEVGSMGEQEQPRDAGTNEQNDIAQFECANVKDGQSQIVAEDFHKTEIPSENILGALYLGRTQNFAGAERPLRAGVWDVNRMEWNCEAIHCSQPEVDSMNPKTGPGAAMVSQVQRVPNASAIAFCEQLAAAIRMAKGLRVLDLSNNQLQEMNGVEMLYLAWSSTSVHHHHQHVDASRVHFFVEGRPCPCANPPCCDSH